MAHMFLQYYYQASGPSPYISFREPIPGGFCLVSINPNIPGMLTRTFMGKPTDMEETKLKCCKAVIEMMQKYLVTHEEKHYTNVREYHKTNMLALYAFHGDKMIAIRNRATLKTVEPSPYGYHSQYHMLYLGACHVVTFHVLPSIVAGAETLSRAYSPQRMQDLCRFVTCGSLRSVTVRYLTALGN